MTSGGEGPGFTFTVPETPGTRWSRVVVRCKHHQSQVIGEFMTKDGLHVLHGADGRFKSEYIGWVPNDAERERISQSPAGQILRIAVASPASDDSPHWRYSMTCGMPSCSTNVLLRSENIERLHQRTCAIWQDGSAKEVIRDLDKWLRRGG